MRKTIRILCATLALLLALPLGAANAGGGNDGLLAYKQEEAARYRAIEQARDAIIEKYGHTRVTLGMFYETVALLNNGATVTLHPIKQDNRLGTYTVALVDGKAPDAQWNLEGDENAWGRAEIEAFTESDRQFMAAWRAFAAQRGDWRAISLEEWADMGPLLIPEASYARESGVPAMPEADDLPYEDAVRLTKEGANKQYGLSMEALDAYEVYAMFSVRGEVRFYSVNLIAQGGLTAGYTDIISAYVASPSGKVEYVQWDASPDRHRLPEGPLADYQEAVSQFLYSGAVKYLPHAERAALQKRLGEAGWGSIPGTPGLLYAVPEEGMFPEEDALREAKRVMAETLDITEELLPLFDVITSLCYSREDQVSWVVAFSPCDDLSVIPELMQATGRYSVYLSAKDGSLEFVERQSPEGGVLRTSWLRSMMEPYRQYTALLEDAAASRSNRDLAPIFQMLRDLGCDGNYFNSILPGEGQLSEEEACALVREKLTAGYGLTEAQLDAARWYTNFTAEGSLPRWYISVMGTKPGLDDSFSIVLDGETGDFYQFSYTLQGNG